MDENRKKKAMAAGTKAVDLADKGLSLIDNLATIFNGIKWLIIGAILIGTYMAFSWLTNLVPSSEDVAEAASKTKTAVVQTATKATVATIDGATKLKAKSIEVAADAKVAFDNSETVADAKVQLNKLSDEAIVVKTDLEIAIDESPTINNAKDKANDAISTLASKVPPLNVMGAWGVLTGKEKVAAKDDIADDESTITPVNYDEK